MSATVHGKTAEITTLSVDVKMIRVDKKLLTLSMFRQLPCRSMYIVKRLPSFTDGLDTGKACNDQVERNKIIEAARAVGIPDETIEKFEYWEGVLDEIRGREGLRLIVEDLGVPWGIVRYSWGEFPWSKTYLVWQGEAVIYRMPVPEPKDGEEFLKFLGLKWCLDNIKKQKKLSDETRHFCVHILSQANKLFGLEQLFIGV